jgi:WD40 repeat protein
MGLCVETDGTLETRLPGEVSIRSLDASDDLLVLGTSDFVPRVLKAVQAGPPLPLRDLDVRHTAGLRSAALRPRNPKLQMRYDVATGDEAGALLLWDVEYQPDGTLAVGEPAAELRFAGEPVRSLVFHAGGRWLAAATDGGLQLVDMEGQTCVDREVQQRVEPGSPCLASQPVASSDELNAVAFSPEGNRLAAAGAGVSLWRFDASSETPLERDANRLFGATGPVQAIAFHPGPSQILAASEGSSVLLWSLDPELNPRPTRLRSEGTDLYSLAFNADGRLLAAGDGRGRFMVWDLEPARYACRLALRNLTQQEWRDLGLGHLKWRRICEDLPG